MTMYHTSMVEIKQGMIDNHGIAGDCLFFSDNVYKMSDASSYVYQADFNCIDACELYDDVIIDEIANFFECDSELAERLLDGRENEWNQDFECEAEMSWWLQGKRGECAVKMGFDGCKDIDEQGTVYIVPMKNREHELTLISN